MLAHIKLQCLSYILEDIIDNGGQMIDNNVIADHIQSFSPALSDNDWAELSNWIKDRVTMHIPMSIKMGISLDALLKSTKQQLASKVA